ncbi:hypothetical protein QE424_003084 [Stenotrophomonas rhizophila]|uniref:Uncharacterized protein n=1 Tax=Stenotrophomonas rhizophila TaxID=216778 RepID=A0AAP5EBK1_9GAMM|nr:hypothetical protein [Stenotrophomonas rhizophila]MDQ1109925.1 hypothetical protein [Stenotrophomonas rhizophila]
MSALVACNSAKITVVSAVNAALRSEFPTRDVAGRVCFFLADEVGTPLMNVRPVTPRADLFHC